MRRCFVVILLLLLTPSLSLASRVRQVNLEEMTQRAAHIFSGRCVAIRTVLDPDLNVNVALVTLEVDRVIKGTTGNTVTVKMLGPQGPGRKNALAGMPRFRRGEEVILFLYAEGASGLTSPVGLGQGKFIVVNDKQGGRTAVNGFGNRALFRGLSERATRRLGDGPRRWRERDGMPPETLLDIVDSLIEVDSPEQ